MLSILVTKIMNVLWSEIWNKFEMKNMAEYNVVLLLPDVFAEFRKNYLESYGLKPRHCFSSSEIS